MRTPTTEKISKRTLLTGLATGGVMIAVSAGGAISATRPISPIFQHFKDRPTAPFGDKVSDRIFNYTRLTPNLGTAGILRHGGLQEAVKLGFKTIIDLRGPDERGVKEEETRAQQMGILRLHIRITDRITPQDQVDQFTAALNNSDQYPILAHCASANRVGGLWALYRAGQGVDPIIAIEEARGCGLTSREAPVREMLGLPAA